MGKYFGTDGFRGLAGVELTSTHAFLIGRFLGYYLKKLKERPSVVIGKDTRLSSYMLEYALASGLASSGADAYMLHVVTSPCVSFVCRSESFDLGIMISASHNPYYDNGIKIVNNANVDKMIDVGGSRQKQTVPLAVIVEFGSGVVGQSEAHPNASAEGYEYNVDSGSKSVDGAWTFYTNSNELDLPQSALLAHNWYSGDRGGGKGQRLLIMTKGAKGVWYAYNAIVDAQTELAKANGGEIGKMWEDIKARYIK
jgi:hypothetical protein